MFKTIDVDVLMKLNQTAPSNYGPLKLSSHCTKLHSNHQLHIQQFFFFTVVCFSRFSILEMTPQHLVNCSNYVLCFVYSIRTVFGSRCYDHFHQFTMSSSGCFVQVFCIYLDQVHVFGLFRIKFGLHRNELNSFIVILLLCVLRLLFVFILFQTIFHFNHKLVGHFE